MQEISTPRTFIKFNVEKYDPAYVINKAYQKTNENWFTKIFNQKKESFICLEFLLPQSNSLHSIDEIDEFTSNKGNNWRLPNWAELGELINAKNSGTITTLVSGVDYEWDYYKILNDNTFWVYDSDGGLKIFNSGLYRSDYRKEKMRNKNIKINWIPHHHISIRNPNQKYLILLTREINFSIDLLDR